MKMITLKQLENLFFDESTGLYQYLKNKNIGGTNNYKGATFENFFTIYKIAQTFNNYLNQDIVFSSQVFCFIDDLVIENSTSNKIEHFQIKDIATLSWETENHPLKDDFKNQNLVCDISVQSELTLVVSKKDLYTNLKATIPKEIEKFVSVIHFETSISMARLLNINTQIKGEILKMCAIKNPSTYILETIGVSILGVWDGTSKSHVSLKEILQQCNANSPNYIKGFINQISSELRTILSSITGFSFQIQNGYIKWAFNNTDEGILQYIIGSQEFIQWENDIRNSTFSSFNDIEPYLS
ncbi:MAG: hypothetical protein ACRYGB_04600 [Janthinobacterium lividum]